MKTKSFLNLLFIASILVLFSSCLWNPVCKTGKGDIVSILRQTKPFENVIIKGSCDATINYADSFSLMVKDYSNLIELIQTNVEGNDLIISYKKGTCVRNSRLEIAITMPHLKSIEINGSGSIEANGKFREPSILAAISGSGEILLNLSDTTELLKSRVSGSGKIDALESVCDSAITEISGSGDIHVNTLHYIKTRISGSGTVTYKGTPVTDIKVSGSGEVKQR